MKRSKRVRVISQIFFFVLVGLIGLNHFLSETGSELPFIGSASLHAICPLGGVETIVAWLSFGVFVPKIHESSMVILVLILTLSVIIGPVVCSYICPLGSIEEWFGKIGKKIFGKKYNTFIPRALDKILRFARYGVLIFVVYLTTHSLKLVFLEVDPYYALYNFWSDEATIGGIIVLVIVLLSSLFIERPWCKYACPFGAVVGLTNLFSLFKVRRNQKTCISCSRCDEVCPMNIVVSQKKTIRDHQCIRCGLCTSDQICPVENTVEIALTESTKEPSKFTSGDFEGKPNPEDIRGSYSFSDIENAFGVEASLIAAAFGIQTEDPGSVKAKDIEEIYDGVGEEIEIGTGSVKKFVSLFTGLPYEGDDFLPQTAVEILKAEGKWDKKMEEALNGYFLEGDLIIGEIVLDMNEKEETSLDLGNESSIEHTEEIGIKGKSTVADAVSYGIPLEDIEAVLGFQVQNENMLIRDLCEQNGLSFGTIKEQLNDMIQ